MQEPLLFSANILVRKQKGGEFMSGLAITLAVLLFILGIVGTILPVMPGVILTYGGMLLYGIMTQFAALDANFYLLQGMAVLLIFSVDFLATAAGAKRFGGSRQAAVGAVIGTIIGLLAFGPFGIILGPFLGAVTAELLLGKKPDMAVRSGFGTLIGILGGTLLKIAIQIMMIIYFFLSI
jgi:uncharacterized protein